MNVTLLSKIDGCNEDLHSDSNDVDKNLIVVRGEIKSLGEIRLHNNQIT